MPCTHQSLTNGPSVSIEDQTSNVRTTRSRCARRVVQAQLSEQSDCGRTVWPCWSAHAHRRCAQSGGARRHRRIADSAWEVGRVPVVARSAACPSLPNATGVGGATIRACAYKSSGAARSRPRLVRLAPQRGLRPRSTMSPCLAKAIFCASSRCTPASTTSLGHTRASGMNSLASNTRG